MSGEGKINLGKNFIEGQGGLLNIGILGTDIYTIVFTLIFFFVSIYLIFILSNKNVISLGRALLIFSFHSVLSILFIVALLIFIVNDIDSYFQIGLFYPDDNYDLWGIDFEEPGYNFRHWGILTMAQFFRIFSMYFHLDFLTINILFACVGSFCLIFLDKLIRENTGIEKSKKNIISYIFLLLVFFPSLSIWSGYLGKEVLTLAILLSIAYVIIKEKNFLFIISYIIPLTCLIGIIRPHFAFFIAFSASIYLIFEFVKDSFIRNSILILAIFSIISVGNYLIGGALSLNIFTTIDLFLDAGEKMRKNFLHPDDYYLLEDDNIFILYFKFLFSPIFNFEKIRNIILSAENICLIVFIFMMIKNIDFQKIKNNHESKYFLIFFLLSSFVMSMYSYQSGIYWRQKWLLLPYLFIGLSLVQKNRRLNDQK